MDAFRCPLLHESEHIACDAAFLDLFRTFGNTISAVMTIDVLERFVASVADAPVDLDRTVGCVADQAVRAVVAHRHAVGDVHGAGPGEAIRRGADYLVVGRPITQAPDPRAAARRMAAEIAAALS